MGAKWQAISCLFKTKTGAKVPNAPILKTEIRDTWTNRKSSPLCQLGMPYGCEQRYASPLYGAQPVSSWPADKTCSGLVRRSIQRQKL